MENVVATDRPQKKI